MPCLQISKKFYNQKDFFELRFVNFTLIMIVKNKCELLLMIYGLGSLL